MTHQNVIVKAILIIVAYCLSYSLGNAQEVSELWDEVAVEKQQQPKADRYFYIRPVPKKIKKIENDSIASGNWRRLAEWYRDRNDFENAEVAYSNFINEKEVTMTDLYNYVLVLKSLGRHQDVTPYMSRMKEKNPNDLRVKSFYKTRNKMFQWKQPSEEYKASDLHINDKNNYFGVAFYVKKDVVLISSKQKPSLFSKKKIAPTSLNTATIQDDLELDNVKSWDGPNWKKYWNEGSISFAKNGKMVAFTDSEYTLPDDNGTIHPQIFFSVLKKKEWQEPEPFTWNDTTFNYTVAHPCLNKRGNILYFASDMPGGFGGSDIYVSYKLGKQGWSKPMNLGDKINTEGDEMYPFFDEPTGLLYFSSNGHNGLGGLDVFEAEQKDSCFCSYEVTNLGSPINSIFNDYAFIFNKKHTSGYFSSDRAEGQGGEDVYKFIYTHTKRPREVGPTKKDDKGKKDGGDAEGRFRGKKQSEKEKQVELTLVISNNTTKQPISNVEIQLKDTVLHSDDNGELIYNLAMNNSVKVTVNAIGYKSKTQEIKVFSEDLTDTIYLDVAVNEKIILNNIYYDFDKSDILSESAKELDKLVDFLNDNPTLNVELTSHTDSRGSDDYNLKLSDERAKSAINYVIKKGISKKRITGHGCGETQLLNKCANDVECTEEEHRINRRTEILIKK